MHRDISVGNMYFYEGRDVLGSLSLRKTQLTIPDMRSERYVGMIFKLRTVSSSINFMAVDVIKLKFLLRLTRTGDGWFHSI